MRAVFAGVRIQDVVYGIVLDQDVGQHALFGIVTGGTCWLRGPDRDPILLSAGDCFLLAPGSRYTFSRDDATAVEGGRFRLDTAHNLLPPAIIIRSGNTQALERTLELLALEAEARAPGSQLVLNHLAEIFVVHAMRAYVAAGGACKSRWLRVLADPHIGAAVQQMHAQLERPWTVMELASIAGMSRSAFASRFKELAGEAPLEHLTRWRMYQAGRLLREDHRKLFEIAQAVGYDSDGAFHKAFKRVTGVTPGAYRTGSTGSLAAVR